MDELDKIDPKIKMSKLDFYCKRSLSNPRPWVFQVSSHSKDHYMEESEGLDLFFETISLIYLHPDFMANASDMISLEFATSQKDNVKMIKLGIEDPKRQQAPQVATKNISYTEAGHELSELKFGAGVEDEKKPTARPSSPSTMIKKKSSTLVTLEQLYFGLFRPHNYLFDLLKAYMLGF